MWLIASALTPSDRAESLPDIKDVAADAIGIGDSQNDAIVILTSYEIEHSVVEQDDGKSLLYFGWHELTIVDGKVIEKFDMRDFLD